MKKLIAMTLALMMLAGVASAELYSTLFKVVDIDRNEDVVTVIDCNKNTWRFDEVDDWNVGDFLTAIMWDAETEGDIKDDRIVSIRYERPDLF